jgi:hypothetical protein
MELEASVFAATAEVLLRLGYEPVSFCDIERSQQIEIEMA